MKWWDWVGLVWCLAGAAWLVIAGVRRRRPPASLRLTPEEVAESNRRVFARVRIHFRESPDE